MFKLQKIFQNSHLHPLELVINVTVYLLSIIIIIVNQKFSENRIPLTLNEICQIDGKSRSIKRSETSGQSFNIVVPSNQNISPFDLAVDTIGRLLFWTCAVTDVINVTRLDNSNPFGSLERKEGEKPRLIAIHGTKRWVSDYHSEQFKIVFLLHYMYNLFLFKLVS